MSQYIYHHDNTNLNPHNIRTFIRTLNVDTIFRENYNNSKSTDFMLSLKDPLKNVVSIKLSSLELPNMWYEFSSAEKTNEFTINCFNIPALDVSGDYAPYDEVYKIIIPDGNYLSNEFENSLNNMFINIGRGLKFIRYEIDMITTKSTFRSANQDDVTAYGNEYPYEILYGTDFFFTLQFEIPNLPLAKTAGWMMGFRDTTYESDYTKTNIKLIHAEPHINRNYIASESSYGSNVHNYVYLEIDDFQRNCITDRVISINKSYLASSILARITIHGGQHTIVVDNASDLIFKKRTYFGPTKLDRFRIRLLDRYGEVIELNGNDYSFVLEIEQLYSHS